MCPYFKNESKSHFLTNTCERLIMNYEEIRNILATSTQDEWTVDDESGTFSYKADSNLQIIRAPYENQTDFHEEWATSHPDKSAKKVDYVVKYRDAVVRRESLISVDGHRAELPMPKSETDLRVLENEVNFAKIVITGGDRVDEYLGRSGLHVVQSY